MSETQVNNFSLISRLFGNLFYRSPTDPILSGVFD
ncbi:MAG: molecular chaperone, partial [Haemophilus parainfluenzae]|nr:molecular chaperone [Haemophilus parainfluenzae]